MDFIGLTDEGNQFIQGVYYTGVYEYTLSDGEVVHLRMFRQQRVPITCSMGGVTEVAQEYVGGKLFTCLVNHGYFVTSLMSATFVIPSTSVVFNYSPEKRMWVVDKPVKLKHAFCRWKRGAVTDGMYYGIDFDSGVIPKSWFDIKERIERTIV